MSSLTSNPSARFRVFQPWEIQRRWKLAPARSLLPRFCSLVETGGSTEILKLASTREKLRLFIGVEKNRVSSPHY